MAIKELGILGEEDAEGTEVKASDISKVSSGMESGVWVNQKRVPMNLPILCHIPQKIIIVMRSIEKLMINSNMGALEFGMFLSGKFDDDGHLVLSEDYFVPQQKVSGAAIDFEEEPPDPKYNGVIHRHPNGCKGFSGTDAFHINRNFDFSILYVDNDINIGIFNIDLNGLRIQVPVKPEVMYPIYAMEQETILSKIKRNERVMQSSSNNGNDNPLFADRHDFRRMLREGNDSQAEFGFNGDEPNGNVEDDIQDDNTEELYVCKKCSEVQYIGKNEFPFCCEGCEEILDDDGFILVGDISELDEEVQAQVFLKMREKEL